MTSPCAACKTQRRKCVESCIFAPYFPADQQRKFNCVHSVFGASNVSKILAELPAEQRADAVKSLAYEAEARLRDPVYGCVGLISILQHRLRGLQSDLQSARLDLSHYIGPSAMLPIYPPPPHHFAPRPGQPLPPLPPLTPSASPLATAPSPPRRRRPIPIPSNHLRPPQQLHHRHMFIQQHYVPAAAMARQQEEMPRSFVEHNEFQPALEGIRIGGAHGDDESNNPNPALSALNGNVVNPMDNNGFSPNNINNNVGGVGDYGHYYNDQMVFGSSNDLGLGTYGDGGYSYIVNHQQLHPEQSHHDHYHIHVDDQYNQIIQEQVMVEMTPQLESKVPHQLQLEFPTGNIDGSDEAKSLGNHHGTSIL